MSAAASHLLGRLAIGVSVDELVLRGIQVVLKGVAGAQTSAETEISAGWLKRVRRLYALPQIVTQEFFMSNQIVPSTRMVPAFIGTNWIQGMKSLNSRAILGTSLVLACVLLFFCQDARAGFVIPSYAGHPHSTTSTWDYNGDWTGGDSASHLTSFTTVGGTYPLTTHDAGCGPGMPCLNNNNEFPDNDILTFYIPNFVDPLQLKLLSVQFKFIRVDPPNPNFPDPFVDEVMGFDPIGLSPGQLRVSSYVTDTEMTDGVFYTYGLFEFAITPNPDYERFSIFGVAGSELREVRIDTISIPEPGVLLLVSAAFLYVGFRNRHG